MNLNNVLTILTRAFFGVYWIFDNLNILSRLKIIEKDPKPYAKTGALFWFLALLTSLISIVKDIVTNEKRNAHLKRYPNTSNLEAIFPHLMKSKFKKREGNNWLRKRRE